MTNQATGGVTLDELVALSGGFIIGNGHTQVVDVTNNSHDVVANALFCCVVGQRRDGHDFAQAAVDAGATALLVERELPIAVPQLVVENVRTVMAIIALTVHGRPDLQLKTIGVTGTNGKTTVVSIVRHLAESIGVSAQMVGTLTGTLTTPDSPDLARQLRAAVDAGVELVALEVSSHALVLHRVDGIVFDVAIFTNLGVDHLDFHETPEAYFAAKALLFQEERSNVAVLNIDDIHGRLLSDVRSTGVVKVSTHDLEPITLGRDGSDFVWANHVVHVNLTGIYNVRNTVVAASAMQVLYPDQTADIAAALATVPQVPGRFERFNAPGQPTVIVDYAHTPDALENVLETARGIVPTAATSANGSAGQLIVVFGCGGDRDRGKRPAMGAIAAQLADRVVITSDNPRSETPATIIEEIRSGIAHDQQDPQRITIQEDRAQAITESIQQAAENDIVVIAGKGHEVGQIFADHTIDFDDRVIVASVLRGATS